MKAQILHNLYMKGYKGVLYPRWVRRLMARTELHRAWLSGYMGIFCEQDQRKEWRRTSVCDRATFAYR
jgi:hypothetical protein